MNQTKAPECCGTFMELKTAISISYNLYWQCKKCGKFTCTDTIGEEEEE